jgi:hypothetical protein
MQPGAAIGVKDNSNAESGERVYGATAIGARVGRAECTAASWFEHADIASPEDTTVFSSYY